MRRNVSEVAANATSPENRRVRLLGVVANRPGTRQLSPREDGGCVSRRSHDENSLCSGVVVS